MQNDSRMMENLKRRWETTNAVFSSFQEMKELPDGYALRFPAQQEWLTRLEEFRTIWKQSCPYFKVECVPESADGSTWLYITGPEGTKSFVEGSHQMLTTYLNPTPSWKTKLSHAYAQRTSRFRVMPDFLIIGAKKCGTTSLYSYITQHPDVAPAMKKEIYFFDGNFKKGLDWYRQFFPSELQRSWHKRARGTLLQTGEASPEYLVHARTPKRVKKTLRDVKLIAILRNPIDRAYSYYQHQLRAGFESLSFEEAIDGELEHLEKDDRYFDQNYSYLAGGFYAKQIKAWRRHFPAEQFLILGNEMMNNNPGQAVDAAFEFLGLRPIDTVKFRKLNAYPYPAMEDATRERLASFFEKYNQELYDFTGIDFGW